MPELAAYIVLATVFSFVIRNPARTSDILSAAFYFTNYVKIFNPPSNDIPFAFSHFWSLAVEEHFYLTWPLLLALSARRKGGVLVLCLAVMLLAPIARITALSFGLGVEYLRYASECRIDSIAYGALLATLMHYRPSVLAPIVRGGHLALLVGGALVLVFTFGGLIKLKGSAHEVLVYCGQGVGLFLVFAYLYASDKSQWLLNILELKPLRFAGEVSYGVYIWHFFAIYAFMLMAGYRRPTDMPMLDKLGAVLFATALATLLGWLLMQLLLKPAANLRRRFGAHIPETRAQSAS